MDSFTVPRQLLVTVDDSINIGNLTRAIKMLKGVTSIKIAMPNVKKPLLFDPETSKYLNDKTMKVINDVRNGKEELTTYTSFEDFEKAMRTL